MKTCNVKEYVKPQAIASSKVLKKGSVHLAGYVPANIILMKQEMRKENNN